MKKLHYLKASFSFILLLGIFGFTTITNTYAQEMTEYKWADYKTKFSVPSTFTVTKSSGEQWEGGDENVLLSIFPRKGENLTQREMNAQLRTWTRDENITGLGAVTDVDSQKLNGYWGVFVEGKKDGAPVCLMLIVDPDYPDTSMYIWVSYSDGFEDTVLKILYSFIPI